MRLQRTVILLFVGLGASAFIFFGSLFALHYDGHQPMGKSFQNLLHDAYGTYVNATSGNFTASFSIPNFAYPSLRTELLDFTNSSYNWQLPTHSTFSDITSDISIENLLMLFGAGGSNANDSTALEVFHEVVEVNKSMPIPTFSKLPIPSEPPKSNIGFHSSDQIRHPAAPLEQYEPHSTAKYDAKLNAEPPMTCKKSYEPTCDMYPYVRFWNKRFFPEDCYASPLRPALKEKTPWDQQKYVLFEPDGGGWNNIRMAAETVMIFAHATGRTLVLPPDMVFYLLDRNRNHDENQSTFHKFFDFNKVRESLNVITMEEFLKHVAQPGLLKQPLPADVTTHKRGKLFKYLEEACYMRAWEPGKWFVGFNVSRENPELFGTFERNKKTQPRYKEMVAHGRTIIPYDKDMHKERAIYFYGRYDTHRMLTHFYTYLYWEDFHTEQIYKRIVRDRLHYHDDIFCGAGRMVKAILQDASRVTHKPVPPPEHADPRTLGGDTNHDATYFAYHIRRGDFQYKDTRVSAETLWENTKHLLNSSVSTLIYIATDEQNKSFFAPFMQPPFTVRFLRDYAGGALQSPNGTALVNMNHLGMIEQVICANAHTFIGTPLSTFTGYITRMRGYYRDGRYERTYYTMRDLQYQLQKKRPLVGPFWAREFEKAHHDIDDYFK